MRLALLIALLMAPMVAHAEPVTAAIAIFAAWAGTTAGIIAITATVLSAGMAIYGSAQARRAERDAQNAAKAAMQDRLATRIATESPHRYIYGRAKVGADIVAMFTSGNKDQYKHIVCILAAHECDAIEEVYVNNVAIGPLSTSGDVTTGRYAKSSFTETAEETYTGPTFTLNRVPVTGSVVVVQGAGRGMARVSGVSVSGRNVTIPISAAVTVTYEYAMGQRFGEAVSPTVETLISPYVRVQKHLGTPTDTADAYLMSVVPSKWTSTSVLRGLCYMVVTLDLNNPEFQGGQVPIHAMVRGKKLYDPRTALTAWSANPSLAIYDYLTSPLCGVAAADLPAAQYITAANVCDDATVVAGGCYTINGTVTADQDQSHVLETMAQCMAGGIVSTTWDIYAGKYVAPVLALDQSDIIGGLSITPGASDAAIYNGVKGQFISPDNSHVLTDFTPYQNPTYRTADGRDLYTNIDFPFTNALQRVHNIARIFTEDQRNGFTLKAEFSLKAWPIKVGQRVSFTSAFLGQSAKIYRVTDKSYSPNSAVELTLKEDAASIWDFADATVLDSTPNTNLPDPWAIAPLASLTCTSGVATLLTQVDGSIVPRILVTWPAATTQAVFTNGQIEVEWRAVQTDTWQKAVLSGSATETYLSPITPGFLYAVRARTVNPYLNTKSDWIVTKYQVAVSTVTPTVYQWAKNMPAVPSGAASYTWGTGAFGAAPSGWSLTAPAAPAGGDSTLWSAIVSVSDISITGSTPFNWNTASISAMGYAPPPASAGPTGNSAAIAYLFQWGTVAPALPNGTATLTWASGAVTSYSGTDSWAITAPTNPGTPLVKLWVATKSVAATSSTTTSSVTFASGASVSAYAQNGDTGPAGVKTAIATAYQWGLTAPTASGSATYTWTSGTYDTVPSTGWSATKPAAPGSGYTLYEASVRLVDSTGATTSSINWATASIAGIAYIGASGGAGSQGASSKICYCLISGTTLALTPTTSTRPGTAFPATGTWGETNAWQATSPSPAAGQSVFVCDGIFDPVPNQTVWNVPYLAQLKVGSLAALTANLGAINAGSMDIGTGATSWHVDAAGNTWAGNASYASAPYRVSNAGAAVFTNITIMTGASTIIDATGLKTGYEAPGTKNSDIVVGGRNLYSKTTGIYDPSTTGSTLGARSASGFTLHGIAANTGIMRMGSVINKNGEFTVSFDVINTSGPQAILLDFCDGTVAPQDTWTVPSTTVLQHFSHTFTVSNWTSATYNFIDFNQLGNQNYVFTNFKVEEGNKATAWTPSPEDVAADTADAALTANWPNVGGTGKPADNATVGAAWSSNLSGRPSNLSALSGSEQIQNSLISIGIDGALSGGATGQATLSGMGLKNWRVISTGSGSSTHPASPGLYLNGTLLYGAQRSYMLAIIDRATSTIIYNEFYDVYGVGANSTGRQAGNLAWDLNNRANSSHIVVVYTFDEPYSHRTDDGLLAAMYRCGASRSVFGSPDFKFWSAYILVGIGGCGEGNGAESYQGVGGSPSANIWCDMGFSIVNGNLTGVSTSYTPKTLADYSYVGDYDATKGAPSGTNVGSTAATTVESNAANGQSAYSAVNDATTGLAQRLRSNAANVLSGGAGIAVGSLTWNSSGVRTGGTGLGLTSAGIAHYDAGGTLDFSIGSSGIAVKGDISGSTGAFSGTLTAAQVITTSNLANNSATDTALLESTSLVLSNRAASSGPTSNSDFNTLLTYSFTPVVSGTVLVHLTTMVSYVTSGGGPFGFSLAYCRVDTGSYVAADDIKPIVSDAPTNNNTNNFTATRYLNVTSGVPTTIYFRCSVWTSGSVTMTAQAIKMIVEVIKK